MHDPAVFDPVHNDLKCERSVVLVHPNLDNHSQSHVVAEGKTGNSDVVLEAGPYVERLGHRIHLDVPGDEGSLDPHESRLEHPFHLDLRVWGSAPVEWHRQVCGLHDRHRIRGPGGESHPLATVLP